MPKGHVVYVVFDSWYASKRLIKFCRRQNWQVICALKSNRRIDKVRVDQHNLTLKHRPYQRVTLEAVDAQHKERGLLYPADPGPPGRNCCSCPRHHLKKNAPGDKRPKYFACTDLALSVQQVLRIYQKRWAVEVDNIYLKQALGLGDFPSAIHGGHPEMVCCCHAGDQLSSISPGASLQQIPGHGSPGRPDPPAPSGTFPESVAHCPAALCNPHKQIEDCFTGGVCDIALGDCLTLVFHR